MSAGHSPIEFAEFSPPTENSGVANAAALLIQQELWGHTNPSEQELDNTLGRYVIAAQDRDGFVLAVGSLIAKTTDEFAINDLVTMPERRGEGLATHIVELLEAKARQLDARNVSVYTQGQNEFFTRIGYVEKYPGSYDVVKRIIPTGMSDEEALPNGVEQLSPEEIGELLDAILEREKREEELANSFAEGVFGTGLAGEEDMHPDEWDAYCNARGQMREMYLDQAIRAELQRRKEGR